MLRYRSWIAVIVVLLCASASLPAQEMVDVPAQRVPVLYDADVVVVGGGLSGVGAAVGAARAGAKTLIIERTGYLGGWLRGNGLGNHLAHRGRFPGLREGVLLDVAKRMVEL